MSDDYKVRYKKFDPFFHHVYRCIAFISSCYFRYTYYFCVFVSCMNILNNDYFQRITGRPVDFEIFQY